MWRAPSHAEGAFVLVREGELNPHTLSGTTYFFWFMHAATIHSAFPTNTQV